MMARCLDISGRGSIHTFLVSFKAGGSEWKVLLLGRSNRHAAMTCVEGTIVANKKRVCLVSILSYKIAVVQSQ